MKKSPPIFALRLLRWFCAVEFLEEIEGDLHEQFQNRLQEQGLWSARLHYIYDVLRAIRPYPERRQSTLRRPGLSVKDSLLHFLKISARNLRRSRSTTIINISGLAISLASFMFIALYLIDESTYDSFHPNAGNIYRISHTYKRYGDGMTETDARVPGLWAVELKQTVPEIRRITRLSRFGYPGSVRYEKKDLLFVEQQFFWVDPNYGELFFTEIKAGPDQKQVLADPHSMIISETAAKRYFGSADPIGESLVYSRDGMEFPLIVAAVMKDYPSNSHFHPDFLVSNRALEPLWKRDQEHRIDSWRDAFTYSYVELHDGAKPATLEAGLRRILKTHLGEAGEEISPTIVRLTDIHFNKGMLIELEAPGDRANLYIFGSIAGLILLIACINYMNLATARSMKRSKEVGLRKTMGVSRGGLIGQFLGESVLTSCIAMALAIIFLLALLPLFNALSGKNFEVSGIFDGNIFTVVAVVTLAVGVLAGSYPAFFLSSFRPMEVLRRSYDTGLKGESFRKILVVTQFAITLLLFSTALVIESQLTFINASKLGTHKDHILAVRLMGEVNPGRIASLADELRKYPFITGVAAGTQLPRQENFGWMDTRLKTAATGETKFIWAQLSVDDSFPAMFNLELVAGRNFPPNDSLAVLINEEALKDLQMPAETAIGLTLENPDTRQQFRVTGVVRNFPFTTVRKTIAPLVITRNMTDLEAIYIQLAGNNYSTAVQAIERKWKRAYAGLPFQYWFLDDEFDRMYRSEQQTSTIVKYFAILATAIGCMGLFGLVMFTAEQKRKEIGIRKVMGASVMQILTLLTMRFIQLVMMAFVIGVPIAYFATSRWLEGFAYKITLTPLYFVLPAACIVITACLTIGAESLRAARDNPADAIRDE